ncbi:hypothetical protein [Bacillus anthracis]|uniref:hypothetical protein n=1 Tax=Bacillus anthracis TaxID=1392 RepID=UPI003BA008E4
MLTKDLQGTKNIFILLDDKFPKNWSLDFDNLKVLTNENLAKEVKEDFERMHDDLEFTNELITLENNVYLIQMETVDYSVAWKYNSNDDTYTCVRFDQ